MSSPTNPDMPRPRDLHPAGCYDTDPRPHVAALLELAALGWHVTSIRPDRSAPVLWRVTIRRYDSGVSITATEADPDDALDELVRYAAVDAEGSDIALDVAARAAAAEGSGEPSGPDERTPGAAAGPEEP